MNATDPQADLRQCPYCRTATHPDDEATNGLTPEGDAPGCEFCRPADPVRRGRSYQAALTDGHATTAVAIPVPAGVVAEQDHEAWRYAEEAARDWCRPTGPGASKCPSTCRTGSATWACGGL